MTGSRTVRMDCHNFNQAIRRDFTAVSCGQSFRRIQTKGDIGNLTIAADIEQLVYLHEFFQRNGHMLPFIVEAGRGFRQFNLLACIDQFYRLRLFIERHTVGRFDFCYQIRTKVKFFTGGGTIRPGGNGIYDLSSSIAHCTVRCHNVFLGRDGIGSAF